MPQVTLRAAAVLVLLTDSPDGPSVLLTERAPDLTQYPGQLVFPGGAAEPGDDGPVGTALREAAEETGLDAASVQILGTLPALALPDSGFLMTPVLAWSSGPVFTGSSNLAEVSSLYSRPLRSAPRPEPAFSALDEVAAPATAAPAPAAPATAASTDCVLGAVTGIVIDLITGMLTHTRDRPGRAGDPGAADRALA